MSYTTLEMPLSFCIFSTVCSKGSSGKCFPGCAAIPVIKSDVMNGLSAMDLCPKVPKCTGNIYIGK